MKNFLACTMIFLLMTSVVFAQNFAGKRIYSGSLNLNLASFNSVNNNNTSYTAGLNFLTGKVKENNSYTAYGFSASANQFQTSSPTLNGSQSKYFSFGPSLELGKFVKIVDKIYFAPTFGCAAVGNFGTNNTGSQSENSFSGFRIGATVTPIRFVYEVKSNIFLSMSVGNTSFGYEFRTFPQGTNSDRLTIHNLSLSGSIANATSIGAFYLF